MLLLVGMAAMVLSQVVSRNQTSLLTSFGAPADTNLSDGRVPCPPQLALTHPNSPHTPLRFN